METKADFEALNAITRRICPWLVLCFSQTPPAQLSLPVLLNWDYTGNQCSLHLREERQAYASCRNWGTNLLLSLKLRFPGNARGMVRKGKERYPLKKWRDESYENQGNQRQSRFGVAVLISVCALCERAGLLCTVEITCKTQVQMLCVPSWLRPCPSPDTLPHGAPCVKILTRVGSKT